MNRTAVLLFLLIATVLLAIGAWSYSPEPDVIAQGLWSAFATCLAGLVALICSRE